MLKLRAKRMDTGYYTVQVGTNEYELVLDEATKQWKIVVVTKKPARERFAKKKDAMEFLERQSNNN